MAQLTVWNNDLKRTYHECDAWRSAAYAEIRKLRPDLLVASQSDSVPWTSVTDKQWATATVSALQALAGSHTRVVFIGDTPQTVADPLSCLESHLDNAHPCSYLRAAAYANFPARHGVLRAGMVHAGFGFVDPLDFFCTTWCPAVVANMVVRRDTGHITNTYATWLSPMLLPLFKDVKA